MIIYATLLKTYSLAQHQAQCRHLIPCQELQAGQYSTWLEQVAAWSGLGYVDILKWRQLPELASPY